MLIKEDLGAHWNFLGMGGRGMVLKPRKGGYFPSGFGGGVSRLRTLPSVSLPSVSVNVLVAPRCLKTCIQRWHLPCYDPHVFCESV